MDSQTEDGYVGRVLQQRYELTRFLGEGAMGVVYLGNDRATQSPVAIKMLSEASRVRSTANSANLVARFKREIATTKRLVHPNIVAVIAEGETGDGMPYVVLEYLEGWDLREVLDDEHQLSPTRTARIGIGVARALEESHRQGVIHRDLKPENIFLVPTPEGEQVKVLDFGIAKLADEEEERLTVAGTALGTPRYMAPEQVMDTGFFPATDVYSFGVLLFEMLSGKIPFFAENDLDLALMHVHETPPKLDVEGMEVGLLLAWQKLIAAFLQKSHRKRPQAGVVAEQLETLLAMALEGEEVHPDKDTQILRFDVATAALHGRETMPRPTRVLGVRTTRSRAVPAKQSSRTSNKPVTAVVPRPASIGDRKQSTADLQRQATDQIEDPQRRATDQLANVQRSPENPQRGQPRAATTNLRNTSGNEVQPSTPDNVVQDPTDDQAAGNNDSDASAEALVSAQRAPTDDAVQTLAPAAAISNRVPRSRVREAMRSGTQEIAVPPQTDHAAEAPNRAGRNALILVLLALVTVLLTVYLIY